MSSPSKSIEQIPVVLESVQWTDIFEDENGKALCVFGIEWKDLSSKHLRTICSGLSIKGVKNFKKSDMVERLVIFHENKKA